MPDVPTLAELGIKGADVSDLVRPVRHRRHAARRWSTRLTAELTAALKLPDVQARIKGLGGEVGALSVEQFADMNRRSSSASASWCSDANIKADGASEQATHATTPARRAARRPRRRRPRDGGASCWRARANLRGRRRAADRRPRGAGGGRAHRRRASCDLLRVDRLATLRFEPGRITHAGARQLAGREPPLGESSEAAGQARRCSALELATEAVRARRWCTASCSRR